MKWVVLLAFVALVPILMSFLRGNPRQAPLLWTLFGFLPFVMDPWHLVIAPVSWAMWPGYVKGLEVSILDVFALATILSLPTVRVKSPMLWVIPVYIVAVLFSMPFAGVPTAAFFYAWQLSRVLLLMVAVAKICQNPRGPSAIITGLIAGICLQAVYAIYQKFIGGVAQASGSFGHQNLLGMVSHFVAFPALALLLVDKKARAPLLGVVSGAIVVILGASRATIGLAGVGYVVLLLLSSVRMPSARKSMIMGVGFLSLVVAGPVALATLQSRFEAAPLQTDYDERAAFERAAKLVIADNPMGIGANQYVVVANTKGYSADAGVVWNAGSRSANVHNTYLLVWAETGYLGLIAFILFMITPILTALRGAWRYRKDIRGDLLLGLGVNLTVVAVHCFFEWIFVEYVVQALFAINVGIVSGLLQRIANDNAKQARERRSRAQPDLAIAGAHEAA